MKAIREAQEDILALLRERPQPVPREDDGNPFAAVDEDLPPRAAAPAPPPVMRARRRKTVILMDDDDATRSAALAAFEKAEVPTRVAADGNAGLAAIAAEKPDVIVMELDMGGSMGGKDVVNMIKATMEWVDIPIVLYTRVAVANQKEARLIHGADDLVSKSPDGAAALVGRVIAHFRRG
jgi:CheY-like chemotaxis protein